MSHTTDLFFLLRDRLQQGFEVDDDLVQQAEAFFGLLTEKALNEVLTGEAFLDSGLAELLVSPTSSFREEVESCIPVTGLSPSEFDAVQSRLFRELKQIPLRLGDGGVVFPEESSVLAALFLNALHLTFGPPWVEGLDIPSELSPKIRAVLREKGRPLDATDSTFIGEFIQGFCGAAFLDEGLTLRALRYSLSLIADREPDSDIFARFALQKTNLQKELAAAEDFRAMFGSRYSMDFLMMSGVKVPTLDEVAAKDEIFLIDKICFTVFRRGPEGLATIQHNRIGVDSGESGSLDSALHKLN